MIIHQIIRTGSSNDSHSKIDLFVRINGLLKNVTFRDICLCISIESTLNNVISNVCCKWNIGMYKLGRPWGIFFFIMLLKFKCIFQHFPTGHLVQLGHLQPIWLTLGVQEAYRAQNPAPMLNTNHIVTPAVSHPQTTNRVHYVTSIYTNYSYYKNKLKPY